MSSHSTTIRYGYQVPHLVLAGVAGTVIFLLAGVALLTAGTNSTWRIVAAAGCATIGAAILVATLGLRWLVARGRPLMTERMLDLVPWTGAEMVLDVGCGPGLTLVGVARRLTTGKVTGLDKWMVIHGERNNSREIAIENARLEGVADRVEVRDGDASDMPFADATFDVVVSSFVFHHIPPDVRRRAVREVVRVTRPGGRVLITDDGGAVELAAALAEAGMTGVSCRRLTFPIRVLEARKPGAGERVA